MTISVNTNYGASIALQQLTATNNALETTQSRISTGLKVGSAKDDGAIFAIAQGRRSELAGYGVVGSSLDRAISTVDVALAAGDAISELLLQLKETALAASDSSLTSDQRSAYDADFVALRDQIDRIANNAEFNGANLVDGSGSIQALATQDGSSTITVAGKNFKLGGTIVSIAATDTVNSAPTATATLAKVESSITALATALAELGTGSKALEINKTFISRLSDTLEAGIGSLVDADLARESARLQSLQTKQQLGAQALSIANSSTGIVLSFFR